MYEARRASDPRGPFISYYQGPHRASMSARGSVSPTPDRVRDLFPGYDSASQASSSDDFDYVNCDWEAHPWGRSPVQRRRVRIRSPDPKTCDCGFDSTQGLHTPKAHCKVFIAAYERLKAEEVNILARSVSSPPLEGPAVSQPYVKAWFATGESLTRFGTRRAAKEALGYFNSLLHDFRADDLKTRDYIPQLLLTLHRDQECYDFITWWVTVNDADHYNGGYDWNDETLPFLDIQNADPFEPVDKLCASGLSLSHLVALTLLKLRLYLDTNVFDDRCRLPYFEGLWGSETWYGRRQFGKIAKAKFDLLIGRMTQGTVQDGDYPPGPVLHDQCTKLIHAVHAANPYFWETLVDSLTHWTHLADHEVPSPPPAYLPGTQEEANLVLALTKPAWERDDDLAMTINKLTASLVSVYRSPASTGPKATVTGQVFPSKYQPHPLMSDPHDIFYAPLIGRPRADRIFKNGDDEINEVLVYTAGACANDGQPDAQGSWAVVYKEQSDGIVAGRLENRGPDGDIIEATSGRSDLRAAIAALRLSDWEASERITGLMIATHSSYVVDIATFWAEKWMANGWKTGAGQPVKNQDLWGLLIREVTQLCKRGVWVQFWHIPEKLNQTAITAAKEAIDRWPTGVEEFIDIVVDMGPTPMASTRPFHPPFALSADITGECVESLTTAMHWWIGEEHIKAVNPGDRKKIVEILKSEPLPSIVILTYSTIAYGRKHMFEAVADRLYDGATVVIVGGFRNDEGSFNRFFARLGVPWQTSYCGETREHNHYLVAEHQGFATHLQPHYLGTCRYLKNVSKADMWYSPYEEEDKTFTGETPVAFTRVGKGMLGYVGQLNLYREISPQLRLEKEALNIVMTMCRLQRMPAEKTWEILTAVPPQNSRLEVLQQRW